MKKKILKILPISIILMIAIIIYGFNLWNEDVNLYYSAGVYSMGKSWSAFFFNSLDSTGFITIDKPPLGMWLQVIFTKIFGFNNLALLLPQFIAALLSIYWIYRIIKKRFGEIPGLVSASVLALTPIFVAVSRNNSQDSVMILLLIMASEQAIIATEEQNAKHLWLASLYIGLAFNIKMLAAFMIVPAVYLVYLLFSKTKLLKRFLVVFSTGIFALLISFSWAIAVDLTSALNRPYIGSSGSNSVFSLIFGYNGISRIFSGGGGPAESPEAGVTSLVRLFGSNMAGQISWFLLPALFSVVWIVIELIKHRFAIDKRNITWFYFGLNFILMFAYFSFASGVAHLYYLAEFAPIIAGLTGIAFAILIEKSKQHKTWPIIAFSLFAAMQVFIQILYFSWLTFLIPVSIVIFAGCGYFIYRISVKKEAKIVQVALLCLSLLVLPAVWSATPLIYGSNSQLPIAGPSLEDGINSFSRRIDLTPVVTYLEAHTEGIEYLAAVPSAMELGAELILQSEGNVMAVGGFNGMDNPLTLAQFQALISANKVKYALTQTLPPGGGGLFPAPIETGDTAIIFAWIKAECPIREVFGQVSIYELTL